MENICRFCFNADVYNSLTVNDEDYFDEGLHDDNDFSSATVGFSDDKHQLYINSGNGEAVNIELCEWFNGRWHTIGKYYPKYCPECGRKLKEYNIDENGTTYKRI